MSSIYAYRFYMLLVISTSLFNKPPYKNLILDGLVVPVCNHHDLILCYILLASVPALHAGLIRIKQYISIVTTHSSMLYVYGSTLFHVYYVNYAMTLLCNLNLWWETTLNILCVHLCFVNYPILLVLCALASVLPEHVCRGIMIHNFFKLPNCFYTVYIFF